MTRRMSRSPLVWLILLLAILLTLIIRSAWVCDDAYITLRTADNLLHGHGLTWNVAERVQTYTHPLWMFMITAAYGISGDGFHSLIVLGVVVSLAAVIITSFGVLRQSFAAVGVMVILALSRSFVDYSTSGLENPASGSEGL